MTDLTGRKVPNRIKTEVREGQKGHCLCGVKSHFIYVDIADDAYGVIGADEVVMLCRSCARSYSKVQLREAKAEGRIYIDPSTIQMKVLHLKQGQAFKRPPWHKWIMGGSFPNKAYAKVRTKHGMLVAIDRREEVEQIIDELMEERRVA